MNTGSSDMVGTLDYSSTCRSAFNMYKLRLFGEQFRFKAPGNGSKKEVIRKRFSSSLNFPRS